MHAKLALLQFAYLFEIVLASEFVAYPVGATN